jgi:hypothetical protein
MNIFEIKEEHKTTVVGYNHSGLPLGKRNDLDKLAEMAYTNKNLAKYFVQLPSPEDIKNFREGRFLASLEEETKAAATDEVPAEDAPEEEPVKEEEVTEPEVSKRSKRNDKKA